MGLHGHVVMEAGYYSDWDLYDPDLKTVPILENPQASSLEKLSKSPELIRGMYAGRGSRQYMESTVNVIGARDDMSFVPCSRSALIEWKSNALLQLETIAGIVSCGIPIMFLLMGLRIEFRNRKH